MLLYSLPDSFENFRSVIESCDVLPAPEALRTKITKESDARKNSLKFQAWTNLVGHHVITANNFNMEILEDIFNLAELFRDTIRKKQSLDHILKGKIMASIFYKVDKRTVQRKNIVQLHYRDARSWRSRDTHWRFHIGSKTRKRHIRKKSFLIVGGGSGGEHPIQTLLDIFTIRDEFGTVNHLKITIVENLKNDGTVHSFARLLTQYNMELCYICSPGLDMPDQVTNYVKKRGMPQKKFDTMEEALPKTDVLYMTRMRGFRYTGKI